MILRGAHRAGAALALPLLLALAASSAAIGAPASAGAWSSGQPGRIVIGFEIGGDIAGILNALTEDGGGALSINRELGLLTATWTGGEESARAALMGIPSVRYVGSDAKEARASFLPNDPLYYRQWGLDDSHIRADLAWDVEKGDKNVVVAVLDTGVDYNHEDLSANIWSDRNGNHGYDFVNGDNDPMDDNNKEYNPSSGHCESIDIYHGTHISGIIGAVMNNLVGIAGIAQVSIMGVKVLDDCGQGYLTDIASGIVYAADQGAKVLTLSLGFATDTSMMRDAMRYAWNKGALIVAAAGNDNSGLSYPAAYPEVVSVGSVDNSNQRSSFSNFGTSLDLVAPGEGIWSCEAVSPYYQALTGTSQAAPHVTGVAALVLSRNPSLTNVQVASILNSTATDLGTLGYDTYYGWGLVNAQTAVENALSSGLNATVLSVPAVRGLVGTPVTLSATLQMTNGTPVVGRSLNFTVDSAFLGASLTDSRGVATFPYALPGTWGHHDLLVTFAGDSSFAQSSREASIAAEVAGSGNITGVVVDESTFQRISLALVSLPAGNIDIVTDSTGFFLIDGVPPGGWTISITRSGYNSANLNATVDPGETTVLSIVLVPQASLGGALQGFPFLALYFVVALIVFFVMMIAVAIRTSRTRLRAIAGGVSPPEIPVHVAAWLAQVHGIDPRRFVPTEVMPVADGYQMTLIEAATGNMIVVRVDRYGRPVYLYLPPQFRYR